MNDSIKLDDSWRAPLADIFAAPQMQTLKSFLQSEKAAGKRVFPKGSEYFRALDLTPLDQVKAVILGQDPYHGEGQAHGLCFSVQPGVRTPPSLVNIYKEMKGDLGIAPARHGFLEHWARQGVLLLNSVLTVEMGRAASHQGKGWEQFTDAIIRIVAQKEEPVVFLLWGAYAQKKAGFVDQSRHLVIKSAHPSPLSAHNGFLGSRPFSKANAFLEAHGRGAIDWALPDLQDGDGGVQPALSL
jgi:uracil-DNA glycosylase